ncbi:hypothetical protein [Rodentibacter sp. Ppn85]|uniref:hypothetical protein n=1 Tax=Rodentibacter sp. Ppn85 TaxID=1908525 RepID=UPI0009871C18|nr:hypothetical protein [Rodentibacter sp. Ppn85]OOF65617.1 hypothetical protein BKL51_04890 [Rodentibacter sp. Ppn85]
MELELFQQPAQKLGIAPVHYDITGRLVHAKPERLSHFIELLKPIESECRIAEFDDVLVCFENEPINYSVEQLALTEPIISFEWLDQNGVSIAQKITQNSTALSLPSLSFGYYQLLASTKSQHYLIRLPISPKNASALPKRVSTYGPFSCRWLKFLCLYIPSLPGILYEYPNWRKKFAQSLEFIFNNESLKTYFAMLNEARKV